MLNTKEITPKTHTMMRWLDGEAFVDLDEGSIRPSRHSKEYAILELIDDDQQAQWIIIKIYTTYEQQQQMHYEGMVTYDVSAHPQNQREESSCYRFTELRSSISAAAADQLLKRQLDEEAKRLINHEVALLISQLRSLDDAEAYTGTILAKIQQSVQPKEKE